MFAYLILTVFALLTIATVAKLIVEFFKTK